MKYPITLVLAFVFLPLFGYPTLAADSDLDPTFSMGSGLANQPTMFVRQSDGKILIGGNFTTMAGVRRNKFGRLNADGSFDATFTNGIGLDGPGDGGMVWGAAVQTDGKIIIIGEFLSVNGVARQNIARLNPDASVDLTFTTQLSDSASGVIVQPDGRILVSGNFIMVNGSLHSRKIARLNSDGSLDLSFQNGLFAENVAMLALQPDGKLILAGGPKRLTRFNQDGSVDSTFNASGSGMPGYSASSAAIDAVGNIYVGGWIPTYNDVNTSNLIRLFPDGSLDEAFRPMVISTISVTAVSSIAVQSDGNILINGFFSSFNGTPRKGIARVSSGGTLDGSFNPDVLAPGYISKLIIQPDQKLVVGGQFTTINGVLRNRIARLNADGDLDPTFARKRGANDSIYSLAPLPGGSVLIGGRFTAFDEIGAGSIARLKSDGSLDTSFNGGPGFSGVVGKIAVESNGKIVVGGLFNSFNGVPRSNIARLNTDGTLDYAFDPGSSVAGFVLDVAIQSDGKVIIVGFFNAVGGVPGRHIARLNVDGSIDTTFNPGLGANFEIYCVELRPNGQILVGGNFDTFNKVPRSSVARLNANGTLDRSFNASTQFDSAVLTLVTQPNGLIVVGGAFNFVDGQERDHVARLDQNGLQDTTFQFGGGSDDNYVSKIALQADGKILVSGTFTSIGGATRGLIARLMPNGVPDLSFLVIPFFGGTGEKPAVNDSAILPNGKILFTHEFLEVGGYDSNRLTRLVGTPIEQRKSLFDFDGDGKTDLAIFRPGQGEWWWLKSSTGGNAALQFGSATDRLTPADFTGDGKTDVAFWRPSTGFWFVLRSEDFSFYSFPFGTNGDVPVPADYDGDGKADAAVFRESAATWYISKSSGGTDIVGFGATGDKPVNADYDGDGKSDIAIFRPNGVSGAEWWIRRSSNASVFALLFGTATDNAVAGDYTGDGKADVAFWRPSTGFWNVLRSEDFSYYAFPFGTNGDVAVPGDYDGDGKLDAAVFRPSSATWYANRSTAGVLIQQFGIAGDVPVPNAFVR